MVAILDLRAAWSLHNPDHINIKSLKATLSVAFKLFASTATITHIVNVF